MEMFAYPSYNVSLISANRTTARINAVIVAIIFLLYIRGKKEWNTVIGVTINSYKLTFVFYLHVIFIQKFITFTISYVFAKIALERNIISCSLNLLFLTGLVLII